MTELEFQSLANEGYNRIPLIAEALADLLIVSQVEVTVGDAIQASVKTAEGGKCQRCWKVLPTVNAEGLCPRCAKAIQSLV